MEGIQAYFAITQYFVVMLAHHCRIIHEAEASGPGSRQGPGPPGTTKIFHHFAPKVSTKKNCDVLKMLPNISLFE